MEQFLSKFKENLVGITEPFVDRMLKGSIPIAFLEAYRKWIPSIKLTTTVGDYDTPTKTDFGFLETVFAEEHETILNDIVPYERAVWTFFKKYDIGTKSYSYNCLSRGTPISVFTLEDEKASNLILHPSNGHGYRLLLVVNSIFVYKTSSYIVTFDLKSNKDESHTVNRSKVRLVKLQKGIVRIGYVIARMKSVFEKEGPIYSTLQSECLYRGHPYYILFRVSGFPPCLGW